MGRIDKILQGVKNGGHLSAEKIQQAQRGAGGRRSILHTTANIATIIEEMGLKVGTGRLAPQMMPRKGGNPSCRVPQLATKEARMDAIHAALHNQESGAVLYRLRANMRKWMETHTWGAIGKEPTLTPGLVNRLVHSLAKRGVSADMVRGVLLMMAVEQGWSATWVSRGQGQGKWDWVKQGVAALQQQGWLGAWDEEKLKQAARQRVHEWVPRPIVISLGSGWKGDVEGFERALGKGAVVKNDISRQNKGTKEGWTMPDMTVNFRTGKRRLVDKVREHGAVPRGWIIGFHASPQCLTQTIIMALEAANGRGKGLNANKETCPEADKAVWQIVHGIIAYLEAEPRGSFTLEQPKGSALQHHAAIKHLEATLNITPVEVRMCSYGYRWQKPTLIWTNLGAFWEPRDLHVHCDRCASNTRHDMKVVRHEKYDHRPAAQLPGFTQVASRNRIAPQLAENWGHAMLRRWHWMSQGSQDSPIEIL